MASVLTGQIAEAQRAQLANYYINWSVDQAAGFLRARHLPASERAAEALWMLKYGAGNLGRLGKEDRYESKNPALMALLKQ